MRGAVISHFWFLMKKEKERVEEEGEGGGNREYKGLGGRGYSKVYNVGLVDWLVGVGVIESM